ncbi:MAG: ankyrin repeat domain-containing protein, partial [Planctomycetota bacterium]
GADVNAADERGAPPLAGTAACGLLKAAELLIDRGADVNASFGWNPREGPAKHPFVVDSGCTALFLAARHGHADVVKLLIAKGAKVTPADKVVRNGELWNGFTPLHIAVRSGNAEVVRFLIGAGADVNATDARARTPLHCSWEAPIIEQLIAAGADVNARDKEGASPLHGLWRACWLPCVKVLLANGAHVNAKNARGATPLFYTEDAVVAECLIEAGADVNARDVSGQTPLHWAASGGYMEVVKVLVANGADLNARDKDRRTPVGRMTYTMKVLGDFLSRQRQDSMHQLAAFLRRQGGKE